MKTRLLCILLCLVLLAVGCKSEQAPTDVTGGSAAPVEVDFASTDTDMFTERDERTEYNESECTVIELNGDSVNASSNSVSYSDGKVNITADGTYLIKGTLNNGTVSLNAPEDAKMQIILSGAHIMSDDYAALHIVSADKVFLTLADGTENSLTNGGAFNTNEEDNVDGALFSKQDLTVNGSGSLTVVSSDHGIVCKDDLVFTGGKLTVTAASHGLDANDSVRIKNTTLNITAGKDGIHADNSDDEAKGFFYMSSGSLDIEVEGDGISSSTYGQIEDGDITILAGGGSENGEQHDSGGYGDFPGGHGGMPMGPGGPGGGRRDAQTQTTTDDSTSMKGIKSGKGLLISGGNIKINSADDGLHSNLSMVINGGTFEIASGDDGVHAEEKLEITECTMTISECYEGLEALHIKVSGGDIDLTATDDGFNAAGGNDSSGIGGRDNGNFGAPGGMGGPGGMSAGNGSIVISGGKLHINASGDGIDANGTLEISGGYTVVVGPTQGDTATLDYDTSAIISGGTFIGTGASGGMAQTFSGSENQGVIAVSVGNQPAGTKILLTDKGGNEIISYAPELNFAVVILSSHDMTKGQSYTITVGDQSADFQAE